MPDRQIKQGSNFANIVLEAQNNAIRRVAFYVAKPKFYEKHRGTLNERREKVVARISLRRAAMIGGLNSIHLAARQEAVEPDKDHPSRHPSSATQSGGGRQTPDLNSAASSSGQRSRDKEYEAL